MCLEGLRGRLYGHLRHTIIEFALRQLYWHGFNSLAIRESSIFGAIYLLRGERVGEQEAYASESSYRKKSGRELMLRGVSTHKIATSMLRLALLDPALNSFNT